MRQFSTSRVFNRMFSKLSRSLRERFIERVQLFVTDSKHPLLNDHTLTGKWSGHRSINITGDFRAIYRELATDLFEFVAIGTHHELFGK